MRNSNNTPSLCLNGERFNSLYRRQRIDQVLRRFLPRELSSSRLLALNCNGFLTNADLNWYQVQLKSYLQTRSKKPFTPTLIDLGCGAGGLGFYLAKELHCKLIGIDGSSQAIHSASLLARHHRLPHAAMFINNDFSKIALADQSISAIISLDALYLTSDPIAVLMELRRILFKQGALLFTVYTAKRPYAGTNLLFPDWKPMLKSAGFSIRYYRNVTPTWRALMAKKHRLRWSARTLIQSELGHLALPELSVSAAMLGLNGRPSFLEHVERFRILAEA